MERKASPSAHERVMGRYSFCRLIRDLRRRFHSDVVREALLAIRGRILVCPWHRQEAPSIGGAVNESLPMRGTLFGGVRSLITSPLVNSPARESFLGLAKLLAPCEANSWTCTHLILRPLSSNGRAAGNA